MLAAVGQPRLMALYEQVFGLYGLTVAQVLLTRADLADRRRYLNSRNTLAALLEHGVIPIINENDTVATEEIRVGDNDNLSALVANLIDADLLLLLTDQAGLYTADPRSDPDAILVNEVGEPEIPEALWKAAGGTESGLGTGGMLTKLQAADLARRSGTTVIIASGDTPTSSCARPRARPSARVFCRWRPRWKAASATSWPADAPPARCGSIPARCRRSGAEVRSSRWASTRWKAPSSAGIRSACLIPAGTRSRAGFPITARPTWRASSAGNPKRSRPSSDSTSAMK